MGLAGGAEKGSRDQMNMVSKAEDYIDKAGDCESTITEKTWLCESLAHSFGLVDFEKIEDIRGECGMLAKKAVISRARGDLKLAQDWATKYTTLYQKQFADSHTMNNEIR
jgi:hypothetical protein